MQGLSRGKIALALAMIVVAVALVLLQVVATGLSCAWDTSYCAASVDKNGVYEGTLTLDGRPYRSWEFEVGFESRRGLPRVSFWTDEQGRYCIRWASEAVVPYPSTPDGESLRGSKEGAPAVALSEWRDLEGQEPPPGCEAGDAGIPWNRAKDASSTWQYWLLIALPLTVIACLVSSLLFQRRRHARYLLVSGFLLLGADLIASAILWGIV